MSLYIGKMGSKVNEYEIHAFTKDDSFGCFSRAEIADEGLFKNMIEERYKSLQSGRTIYCTAVNPDSIRCVEENPHDSRSGTVHVATIDERTGKISCILSIAVDTGETEKGELIGLPLENRWRNNGYPTGSLLDDFRERYLVLNRGENSPVRSWQMAELYRHLRVNGSPGEQVSRLGIYVGLYHLLVREPRKRGLEETSIWVFDAIPKYFHLYRLAGAAVLRDPVIEEKPRHISPGIGEIQRDKSEDRLIYKGEVISRYVETLKPLPGILGDVSFAREQVPFLDGVIDIHKMEQAVIEDPAGLSALGYEGMNSQDMEILRIAVACFGKRHYKQMFGKKKIALPNGDKKSIVSLVDDKRKFIAPVWDFNGVGE